jgi:hypothetical protein
MKNNLPTPNNSKSERAQSLVEFTISLLLILTILTGAVEVSLALFEYVTISNAAQEGALYGSINPSDGPGIRARVTDSANDGLALTDSEIGIGIKGSGPCEKTVSGIPNQIQIKITHPHRIVMPLAGTFLGQQINLSASATNTILQPTCP